MEKLFTVYDMEYIVSTDGKIYSTKNNGRGKYHKEISQRENADGYMMVTCGKNNHRRTERVHRIIAKAFIENPSGYLEVDHIDGNRKNNNVSNLRWISGFDNKSNIPFEKRSISHRGEKNGRSRLTHNEVIEIRRLHDNGATTSDIAKLYGRGWSTIYNIITEQTWKHIATNNDSCLTTIEKVTW